ncbi:hypothetical protein [Nostoc sp.]|uniref:hypothetical protein n=1 Tax=Nostoc sp. TaxID=1180 RepID=UPI002FF71855
MLNNLIKLIKKNPRESVAVLVILLVLYSGTHQPPTHPQEQAQVNDPTDYVDDEPFDKAKCKVYYAGILLGANVFWFKNGTSGTYLMFTDSDQLVDKHQNRGISIWLTKADFLNLIGNNLRQQMEPEVKEVFARRLDSASYVAVIDDSLTARAINPANTCVR